MIVLNANIVLGERNVASAFDPFKPDSVYPVLPDNSLVGIDLDAIFGPSNGELMNATDPFGSDPFTPSFLGNNKAMKNHVNSSLKKSPPPRPKTQPTLGKSTRSSKFMDDSSNFRSAESKGDYTDFDSSSTLTISSRYRKHSTDTGGSSNLFQKPSFSLKSKHSAGKSKKDALNSFTAAVSSPSFGNQNVKTGTKSSSGSDPPLSDEARLSWAIIESQRLAQIEEEARRQEEADLELALRLSRLDSSNQP
ncbi:hypothetical protein MN116_008883 [Schistosoma mekongi]|uniref:Epidermal growth factor receptor substrate 15-like 1 n=1 Tax=Schistosoma mekongi TaxID=38744 RepID=A0AAE1Z583_SCHME|nr:hypothetical protein MN116_008883 [Schistosoma mekongi]